MSIAPNSARDTDDTARVLIALGDSDIYECKEYSIDNDVLSLGDPFRVVVSNPDGRNSGKMSVGQECTIAMQDPAVGSGAQVSRIKGIITSLEYTSDASGGGQIIVSGADLGWFLTNCHAPLWLKYQKFKRLDALFAGLMDPTWGIGPVEFSNEDNVRMRQGRTDKEQQEKRKAARTYITELKALAASAPNAGRAAIEMQIQRQENYLALVYPLQIEPGQVPADLMIEYARREKRLVNVTSYGSLAVFAPNDAGTAEYSIHYHRTSDKARALNNVLSAKATDSIESVYRKVICVGTVTFSGQYELSSEDQNATKRRGTATDTGVFGRALLPFDRLHAFSDAEQYNTTLATNRAKWKLQRGAFDAERLEYTVKGHSQGGKFWTPDTCADVFDTVHKRQGRYYVRATRYTRSQRDGTKTQVTLHPSGLLSA